MKNNLRLGGILLFICIISGGLLSVVNNLTKDAIIENSKINKNDLAYVLEDAENINDYEIELLEESAVKEVYEALKGDEVVGYVFKITTKGFHGGVDFVAAIQDDTLTGIKVLSHSETPGLGAKINELEFIDKFKNLPIENFIELVKTSKSKDNEVEAVSGATISSTAAVKASNEAIAFYLKEIKGENVELEINTDADSAASAN